MQPAQLYLATWSQSGTCQELKMVIRGSRNLMCPVLVIRTDSNISLTTFQAMFKLFVHINSLISFSQSSYETVVLFIPILPKKH